MEKIAYCYTSHLASYQDIRNLPMGKGATVAEKATPEGLRFYEPVAADNKRFYIVEDHHFEQIEGVEQVKVSSGFAGVDWSDHHEAQAIVLDDARLFNKCVIYQDLLFSESIARNVNENFKRQPIRALNPEKNVLRRNYSYYSYDSVSNTAAMDLRQDDKRVIESPCFLFNSVTGTRNFGHFVHDTLAQVAIYDFAKSLYPDLVPVVISAPQTNKFNGFRYAMLEWLFRELISENYLVLAPSQQTLVKKLVLPRKVTDVFGKGIRDLDKAPVQYLKNKLFKLIERQNFNNRIQDRRTLFISRKDGNNQRSFFNQDELDNLLDKKGIQQVVVSQLPPVEILRTFSSANRIVGCHGAGLMNYIFAPQPVTLLEIEHKPQVCPRSIRDFANVYGVDYSRIPVYNSDTPGIPSVDIDVLAQQLDNQKF